MIKFILILFFPLCVYSQGSLVVSNGTNIISTNNPIINLYNTDLYNNTVTSNLGQGTIWSFTGNVPQNINGTNITNFHGLRLNNTNGYTLSSNTTITNRLEMVSGNVDLNGHTLEIGSSTSNPGEINWTSGTIIGPLKRWFAPSTNSTQSSGIFPIGNDVVNRNVIINYTQAPTEGGYIVVEYKNGVPSMTDTYSGLPLWTPDGQLIQNYENQGYFDITPFDYNSSLNSKQFTLSMRGNNLLDLNNKESIRLIKSPGPTHTTWIPVGNHISVSGSNSDFVVTSTGITGFSWFNFGSSNENPLPVELTEFTAVAYSDWNTIKWVTSSESNSDYYSLLSSEDGESWMEIHKQNAAGNSIEELKYFYIDYTKKELTYYKLIQFDKNGENKTYGPILAQKVISSKIILKYTNLLGQEININESKGVIIIVFTDGTTQKIIR